MQKVKSQPFPLLEGVIVILILVGFILVNIFTSLNIQNVWLDEVTVADPAVNLYLGNGFTSTAWQYQTKEEFWASNAPLHQILLYHWLLLFGLSPIAVRSINFVLMAIAVFFIWLAVYRLNIVTSFGSRLALIAISIFGYGITINYMTSRYDCIGISLFAALFLAYSIKQSWMRCSIMLSISILIPLAGINLLPYTVILVILLLIYLQRKFWQESLSIALGTGLGIIFLYVFYVTNGVAKVILASAGGHSLASAVDTSVVGQFGETDLATKMIYVLVNFPKIMLNRLANIPIWFFQDPSFVALLVLLLGFSFYKYRTNQFKSNSILSFGLAVAVVVPICMGILRDYPIYYSWMAYIPISICVTSFLAEIWSLNKLWRFLGIVFIVAACVPGYPTELVKEMRQPSLAKAYIKLEQFVNESINPEDRVYSDFEAYYVLKKMPVEYVLLPTYQDMMSEREKQELSALIVKPENYLQVVDLIGGNWVKQDELLERPPYMLELYRRK